MRVLYSFPHRLGADRICYTAWQQINGLAQAGAEVEVHAPSLERPLHRGVDFHPTLSAFDIRVPFRLLGDRRVFALHDWIVSQRLRRMVQRPDIVHVWPQGAARTLAMARSRDVATALERPNAHTRYAYEVVHAECDRLGVTLPPGHEHAYNEAVLAAEEKEFGLADALLCPSDFVVRTFLARGFASTKLVRHQYGFDEAIFHPPAGPRRQNKGLAAIFVGGCAPRKGLHFALEAWLGSEASQNGRFLVVGEFVQSYRERLAPLLSHSSVLVLGHRRDIPALMQQSDVLLLPSLEEGSALVTSEARGCGCVLLVSESAGAICTHGVNSLVHEPGTVSQLREHLDQLHRDRGRLESLREASLRTSSEATWSAAGRLLLAAYERVRQLRGLPAY
jgi:glycosyltransferase involved in cell wall biosynthesis